MITSEKSVRKQTTVAKRLKKDKQKGLTSFFESYLQKEPLFSNKHVLQEAYTPDTIPHREEQISMIAQILAPALRGEKPSNLFVYGKTGTGKTLSIKYTSNQLLSVASKQDIPLKIIYINCKLNRGADTEYRILAQLVKRGFNVEIPYTGLPTDEVYNIFFNTLEKSNNNVIIILDEVDQLVKKAGDEILYSLTRLNTELKNSIISLIGISNDLLFTDELDPRIKSSLSEEEIVFPPYNAVQLQDILRDRATVAFKENVIGEGVIEKCAAYAAREHGDARRALELLRVAGEIAERKASKKVEIHHIDEAEEKIERDRLVDMVTTFPKQTQAILFAITTMYSKKKDIVYTGEVYEFYKTISHQIGLRPLTQRRVSDTIGELDMLGLINAKVISKGRYGRTREISVSRQSALNPKILNILKEALGFKY